MAKNLMLLSKTTTKSKDFLRKIVCEGVLGAQDMGF